MPNWRHSTAIFSPSSSRAMNLSRSSIWLHSFQGTFALLAKGPVCNPCLRNELSPISQEGHSSNRCVFVVSSLAGIVLKLPRVSYPAKASAATRDAKCLGAGRERTQGLSRPFSSRRMWTPSRGRSGKINGFLRLGTNLGAPVLNSLPKFRLDDRLVLAGGEFLAYPAAAPRNRTGFPRIPTGLKPPDVRGPEFSPRQSDKNSAPGAQ